MSESYVMCGKDEGEELEVVKVICSKCDAYEFMSPANAAKVTDSSFQCSLCSNPKGVVKLVKSYVKCAACGQTMDPISRLCYCIPENKPMLTWYNKPNEKNPIAVRREQQIEESKLQGLERKVVRTARQKQHDMEVRTDENLQKLVELLLKKEEI